MESYYITISVDGRSTSYPRHRYTAREAWKAFYREMRYYGEHL